MAGPEARRPGARGAAAGGRAAAGAREPAREAPEAEDLGPAPLAPLVVPAYLEPYGYAAADFRTWRVAPGAAAPAGRRPAPRFGLGVAGHEEINGHTWYTLACALVAAGARMDWSVQRRLVQLRENLHDAVQGELGDAYAKHFANAPFAHKGGFPGTTARLHSWCGALASCINTGHTPPSLVALALHFLEAPEIDRFGGEGIDLSDIELSFDMDDDED